jgi:hypothetical protein
MPWRKAAIPLRRLVERVYRSNKPHPTVIAGFADSNGDTIPQGIGKFSVFYKNQLTLAV